MSSIVASLLARSLYDDTPPPSRTKAQNIPTLLYSWWCTLFAMAFIITRLGGRMLRNEMLFREDKIMAVSMIPLLIRMAFIHVVLIWGTNNEVVPPGASAELIRRREIGSRLVLAARVFYALYIWTAKFTVLEFLRRMTKRFWRQSYEIGLQCITWYLVASFIAVVIATIAECQPITHYWQVVPDPGPQCREGLAQLITMGVADSTTDILIVVFPVPIILASGLSAKRKIGMTLLFSLSLILIAVTVNRVTAVINLHGRQQYRTVWASSECLAAAITSNAVIIGSFLRDRGVKKNKFRFGSQTDSMERASCTRQATLTTQHWGSDEDLVAGMGYRLEPELQSRVRSYRAPGALSPAEITPLTKAQLDDNEIMPISSRDWQFPHGEGEDGGVGSKYSSQKTQRSDSLGDTALMSPRTASISQPRSGSLSFADIGGLLDGPAQSRRSSATLVPNGSSSHTTSSTSTAAVPPPSARRGSRTMLLDLGGYLSASHPRDDAHDWTLPETDEHEQSHGSRPSPRLSPSVNAPSARSRSRSPAPPHLLMTSGPPMGILSPRIPQELGSPMSLQDAGGLLTMVSPPATPATTIAGRRQSLQDVGGLLSVGAEPTLMGPGPGGETVLRHAGEPASSAAEPASNDVQPELGRRASTTKFREEF